MSGATLNPQAAYLLALAAYQIEADARKLITEPLHAAVAAGTMSKEEYFAAMDALDDEDGALTAYWAAWNAKQDALIELMRWGRAELHRAWATHGRKLPGCTLEMLDALFDSYSPRIRAKLTDLVLRLDVTA